MKAISSSARRLGTLWATVAASALLAVSTPALDVDRYAWEFPVPSGIPEAPTAALRAELMHQVEDVLEAGFLTGWTYVGKTQNEHVRF